MATAEELLTILTLRRLRELTRAAQAAHNMMQVSEEKTPDFAEAAIKHILDVIELSRNILDFEDDWDEEGSSAYKPATWERATNFLRRNALQLWEKYHVSLEAPKILPGPAGSIDLHWRTMARELLINIPETHDEPANFYGDDSSGNDHSASQVVKGILDTSKDNPWLLMWLMQ